MKKIFISIEGLEGIDSNVDYIKLYHAISDIVINNGYDNLYILTNNLPVLFYVYLVYNLLRHVDGLAICDNQGDNQADKAVVAFSSKGLKFGQDIDIKDAVKIVVDCRDLSRNREIIFPAHSIDTNFYAMTPEGDLICFFTGEDGILPEGYPTLEELEHLFSKVVRECIKEKEVKKVIKDLIKEEGEDEKNIKEAIEHYSSDVLLKFGYYYLSGGDNGDIAEDILNGNMDFSGTLFWYFLDTSPQYENKKVREAIKKYLGDYLPVIEPEGAIRFEDGVSYEETASEELITVVLKNLTKYRDFWRRLKEKFSDNNCNSMSILLINTKIIPCDIVNTFLIMYPSSEILKQPGVYCIDSVNNYDDVDLQVALSLLKFKHDSANNAVVVVNNADELLEFCRSFYREKIKKREQKGKKTRR